MDILVRRTKKSDLKPVFDLLNALNNHRLDFQIFQKSYKTRVKIKGNYYLCALVDKKIIGVLIAEDSAKLCRQKPSIFIDYLYVDEAYRKSGVGQKLIEYLVASARNDGIKLIEVTSTLKNQGAHKFYEKTGFLKRSYKFRRELS